MRSFASTCTLLSCGLLSGGLLLGGLPAGGAATPLALLQEIVATAHDATPQSRVEAEQGIDAAVAAALIAAIAAQFDAPEVEIKLERIAITPDSVLQRDVSGDGRLLLGSDGDVAWIPFHFNALYDTREASVGAPSLTFGAGAQTHEPPARLASDRLRARLGDEVERRLHAEFAGQPVRVSLASARVFALSVGDGRYLRLEADGLADFGREGRAAAGVHALYDIRGDRWLQLRYELGASANRVAVDPVAPEQAVARR